jgi:hypothetical protein
MRRVTCQGVWLVAVVADHGSGEVALTGSGRRLNTAVAVKSAQHGKVAAPWKDGRLLS